jgi:GAF domain-containing protein
MTTPSPEMVGLAASLGDALGTAMRPLTLDEELRKSVTNIRGVFSAAACSCALVDDDGTQLRFAAADGAGADAILGVSLPVSRGIAGWVAMSGQPIVVSDVSTDSRFARDVAESTNYMPETILAAPLVDPNGEVAGVIEVLDPQARGAHSGYDLAVLGLVSIQLASIIRLSALYDALGSGLLRALADPEGRGGFDEALSQLADTDTGVALTDLAEAFRDVAQAGPEAARLAERILRDVGGYLQARR